MNEETAKQIIAAIDETIWLSRLKDGTIVCDGGFTAQQLIAIGTWFSTHDDFPVESPHFTH